MNDCIWLRTVPARSTRGPARLWLAIFVALAAVAPAAAAERLPLPPLAGVERGAYRARDLQTGEELSRGEWLLRRETHAGRPVVHLEERGEERAAPTGPTAWSAEMRLDFSGAHPVLTSTRESRDDAGRPVEIQRREFDYGVGTGEVTTTEVRTGGTASRAVRLTGQAITTELLPAILRLLPERTDGQMQFDLVAPEGRTLGMRASVVGRETVSVPAGTFDCFKVALEPLGLIGALATLKLVKLFMWQTVAPPHFWVKYEGPDAGVDARPVVRELVRFDTGGQPSASQPSARPQSGGPEPTLDTAPRGGRARLPRALGYIVVLAAVLFEIGVETTRLLDEWEARARLRRARRAGPEIARRPATWRHPSLS